jgi:ubiquinone/menaquinone biosynthesis C-methylase UbiE
LKKTPLTFDDFKKGNYDDAKIIPAYSAFAKHYDFTLSYLDYHYWAEYIKSVFKHFSRNPKSIIEFCSGTGELANILSSDFMLVPCDASSEMIKVSKQKYPGLNPVKLNMISFSLKTKYDAAISFNDNINYITDDNDLLSHFGCVKECLKEGGLYLFDCTPFLNVEQNFCNKTVIKKTRLGAIKWNTKINKDGEIEALVDIYEKGASQVLREIHKQQVHESDKIIRLLKEAGFGKIHHFDGFSLKAPNKKSVHYHFAAFL